MSSEIAKVRSFTRNPVTYAKRQPVAAGVLLTAALVGVSALRSGRRPDARAVAYAAIAAAVFVVVAGVAPQQIGWVVLVGLFIMVWQNADAIEQIVVQATGGRLHF